MESLILQGQISGNVTLIARDNIEMAKSVEFRCVRAKDHLGLYEHHESNALNIAITRLRR